MNNFTQRALTGAVFVLILVGAILFNAYTYLALFLLITLGGTWEFYGLIGKGETGRGIPKLPGTIVSGGIFVLSALIASGKLLHVFWLLLLPLTGFVFIAELYRKYEKPFINIAFTFLGLIYVCLPFSILSFLAFNQSGEYDPQLVMGFFILLWCSDTGAYIAGKTMGRHKLFERISPKKTWEGSIGGCIISILAAWLLSGYFTGISRTDWVILSVLIVVFGTLGDLVESMLKRSVNIKDSGSILPGHGGVLDRFDGLLLSVPFVLAYLYLSRLL